MMNYSDVFSLNPFPSTDKTSKDVPDAPPEAIIEFCQAYFKSLLARHAEIKALNQEMSTLLQEQMKPMQTTMKGWGNPSGQTLAKPNIEPNPSFGEFENVMIEYLPDLDNRLETLCEHMEITIDALRKYRRNIIRSLGT